MAGDEEKTVSNFIRTIINQDLESGKHQQIQTRFPPEPNGFLHIGHAKAICVNFGLALDYKGRCNLRFDDTNPDKEEQAYIDAIKEDIAWLGFEWGEKEFYASDYFDRLHRYAERLIREGKAYVDDLTAEQIREYRGTLKEPGKPSPYRDRSVEENLDLFAKMKAGEFDEGACVLRAKIDMASPNMNLRDPAVYRIKKTKHHRTGDNWSIYPMYDFTHCVSDAEEGITHSLCSLEFEDHRPLYDWFLDQLKDEFSAPKLPRQIEFARLFLSYTVMSKRKLRQLVEENLVESWDDPRMPTLAGYRRRGYTATAIRNFSERVGVAKANSLVDVAMLEHAIREDLNDTAERRFCVLDPIKVTITNYPADKREALQLPRHQQKPDLGTREMPFSAKLYIDREDFMEDPPKKFFRLGPGREVRLRNAYIIRCDEVIKDDSGQVVELKCSYDADTLGKNPADGRKVKGIIHWLEAESALPAEVRLYDRLFQVEQPDRADDFKTCLNPDSLSKNTRALVEPSLAQVEPEQRFQFERVGYFVADRWLCKAGKLVFNKTVGLRDTWAKTQAKG